MAPPPGVHPRPGPVGAVGLDKWLHAAAYAGLAAALAAARSDESRSDAAAAGIAVIVAVAYGGGLELVQAWLPHRHAGAGDLLADAAGAAVGAAGWRFRARLARRRRRGRSSR